MKYELVYTFAVREGRRNEEKMAVSEMPFSLADLLNYKTKGMDPDAWGLGLITEWRNPMVPEGTRDREGYGTHSTLTHPWHRDADVVWARGFVKLINEEETARKGKTNYSYWGVILHYTTNKGWSYEVGNSNYLEITSASGDWYRVRGSNGKGANFFASSPEEAMKLWESVGWDKPASAEKLLTE